MIKRIIVAILLFSVSLSIGTGMAKAEGIKSRLSSVEKEKQETTTEITAMKKTLADIQEKKKQTEEEIRKLDEAVMKQEKRILSIEERIQEYKEKLEKIEKEEVETRERVEARAEVLKNRFKTLQKEDISPESTYINVLLGAEGFSDFMERLFSLAIIVNHDNDLVEEHKRDLERLERLKELATEAKNNLDEAKEEAETAKKELEKKQDEKKKLMASIMEKEKEAHDELVDLNEEKKLLESQEKALKSLASRASSSGFLRPSEGYVTSGFGYRWGRLHAGVDIAKSGTVPVVAAASGTVIRSYYSSSYGNVVFIAHRVNGTSFTTVYAHLRNRAVSEGEHVDQGDFLGNMGNTGRSYGQHLHFEIHKGGWTSDKRNAVDPMKYIR